MCVPKKTLSAAILVATTFCFATQPAAAVYLPGFSWQRSSDWVTEPASYAGTANGNPVPDSAGNPVWSYEWVQGGGGIGTANPWYAQPSQKLLWDTDWYGHGYPVWARAAVVGNGVSQDYSPMVAQTYMVQNLANSLPISSPDQSPIVRWMNPANDPLQLSISGTFQVGWSGETGGYPVDVDLVLAEESAAGSFTVLFSSTVNKPHDDTTFENVDVPVNTWALVNPGDSLVISLRANGESSGNWITLSDPLTITVVPEPATPAVMAMGLVALCAGLKHSSQRPRPRFAASPELTPSAA